MNGYSDFVHYNSHDLACDESFQAYVFLQNNADIEFWEHFIINNPEKHPEIDEAKELLKRLAFKRHSLTASEKQLALSRLLFSIERNDAPGKLAHTASVQIFNYPWARIAATLGAIAILISAGFYLSNHFIKDNIITHRTPYGKNSTIVLPDSSLVILNGNTTLFHHHSWDGKNLREVWVDGEAFFDVRNKKGAADALFVVHTPGMDVEVLGTKFNVFNRDDQAHVVLNSGKVKVNIATNNDTSTVLMDPNEALEFFRKNRTITKTRVNAEALTAWRNNVLVFENTPLHKITEMIEYTYGVHITVKENVDIGEKLVGTVPSGNLDVLLSVLEKSSNLLITRNKDQIIIEKEHPLSGQIKN